MLQCKVGTRHKRQIVLDVGYTPTNSSHCSDTKHMGKIKQAGPGRLLYKSPGCKNGHLDRKSFSWIKAVSWLRLRAIIVCYGSDNLWWLSQLAGSSCMRADFFQHSSLCNCQRTCENGNILETTKNHGIQYVSHDLETRSNCLVARGMEDGCRLCGNLCLVRFGARICEFGILYG